MLQYLESKEGGLWSETTMRSESSRLRKLEPMLSRANFDPATLLKLLRAEGYKEYTIKKSFVRLDNMFAWALKRNLVDRNVFGEWLEDNSYVFKNAYKKKQLSGVTYESALRGIENLDVSKDVRDALTFLLKTGLRLHELGKVEREGESLVVVGKGGKKRRIFYKGELTPFLTQVSSHRLRSALAVLDLTPHDLRRLYATRLLKKQIPIHDVAKATGHSSIETLLKYLQTSSDDELMGAIEDVL